MLLRRPTVTTGLISNHLCHSMRFVTHRHCTVISISSFAVAMCPRRGGIILEADQLLSHTPPGPQSEAPEATGTPGSPET